MSCGLQASACFDLLSFNQIKAGLRLFGVRYGAVACLEQAARLLYQPFDGDLLLAAQAEFVLLAGYLEKGFGNPGE
mgnify:CR=1 FL=1